jgi:hypothetical protein
MPDWLRTLVQPPEPAPNPPTAPAHDVDTSAWARAALDAEIRAVATAREGQRNHTLNRAAFALGQLVAARHLDQADVASRLEAAGISAGLGPNETRRTINSGLLAGQQHPRHPAPRRSHGKGAAAYVPHPAAQIDLRTIELTTPAPAPRNAAAPALDVALDLPALP